MSDELTYSELTKLQRKEKETNALQDLGEDFIKRVTEYVKRKKELINKEDDNVFSRDVSNKARIELSNAKKILKDLYDYREKKVLNQALLSVRSGVSLKDTTLMLSDERKLYDELLSLLKKYREKYEKSIEAGALPKRVEENQEVIIKILERVPNFVGPDNKIYGPYTKGEVISLNKKLAEILIKDKKAQIVKE